MIDNELRVIEAQSSNLYKSYAYATGYYHSIIREMYSRLSAADQKVFKEQLARQAHKLVDAAK
jgi:hypothetical protein